MSVKEGGRSTNNSALRVGIRYVLGLIGCLLPSWLLLCVLAKIMCMTDIPGNWLVPLTTCCSSAGILIGALLYTKKIGHSGALWGSLLALGCWCVVCLIGVIQGQEISELALLKLLAFVCAGMTGGIAGVLLKEKRRKVSRR